MRTGLRTLRWVAGLLTLAAAACAGQSQPQIRIANRGDVPLENIVVSFHSQTEQYGTLAPGGVSDYRSIAKAYSVARIEATANGEAVRLQPIDFVGDEPLDGGLYTYALSFDPTGETSFSRLRFEFVED